MARSPYETGDVSVEVLTVVICPPNSNGVRMFTKRAPNSLIALEKLLVKTFRISYTQHFLAAGGSPPTPLKEFDHDAAQALC
jgi:hypothetical protein